MWLSACWLSVWFVVSVFVCVQCWLLLLVVGGCGCVLCACVGVGVCLAGCVCCEWCVVVCGGRRMLCPGLPCLVVL